MDQAQCIHVFFNELLIEEHLYKFKTLALNNYQSLQIEHGIKSLPTILTNHLTGLD